MSGPALSQEVPVVSIKENEIVKKDEIEGMLHHKISETASQALDRFVPAEDFKGQDNHFVKLTEEQKKAGFKTIPDTQFEPTSDIPNTYKTDMPNWLSHFLKGEGMTNAELPLENKKEMAANKGQILPGGEVNAGSKPKLGIFGKIIDWFYEDPKTRTN